MQGQGDETERKPDMRKCLICRQTLDDPLNLGEKLSNQSGDLVCHYYCLLFSCNLIPRSEQHQGLKGFLEDDIREEIKRGGKLKCTFCKINGATSACCVQQCKVMYHLPCALFKTRPPRQYILFQFYGSYESFCRKHAEPKLRAIELPAEEEALTCLCCFEEINREEINQVPISFIQCEDCLTICHQPCIKKFALTAGRAYFRCPKCALTKGNDHKTSLKSQKAYIKNVRSRGVFVPKKHADWEMDMRFDDQYQDHDRCNARICLCPEGRIENERRTFESKHKREKWYIPICAVCGKKGCHRECDNIPAMYVEEWVCWVCRKIFSTAPRYENIVTENPVPLYKLHRDDDGEEPWTNMKPGQSQENSLVSSVIEVKLEKASPVKNDVVPKLNVRGAASPTLHEPECITLDDDED